MTSNWPEGWNHVPHELRARGVETAHAAITWAGEPRHELPPPIVSYYRRDGNYAGALFTGLLPNDPDDITAVDLFATSTLSVQFPARAARLLLDDGPERRSVLAQLAEVRHDVSLSEAAPDVLESAEVLHGALKKVLGRNPWVTASKLAARKRPALIPVRDRVIVEVLGLGPRNGPQTDWHMIGHLISDPSVRDALTHLRRIAQDGEGTTVEAHDLRLLDVALWMWGSELRRGQRS